MGGMKEKFDDTLHRLNLASRKVSQGNYTEAAQEIFSLTNKEKYSGIVAEMAESFGMMIVKVEARNMHLKNLIEELEVKNDQLEKEMKLRAEASRVLLFCVGCLGLYTISFAFIKDYFDISSVGILSTIVNIAVIFSIILMTLFLIVGSNRSLSEFGFNLNNWSKSLRESLLVAFVISLIAIVLKYYLINNHNQFVGKSIFNLEQSSLYLVFVYFLSAPVQEFLARGIVMTLVETILFIPRFRTGLANVVSALIFGVVHLHLSPIMGLSSFLLGLIFGTLYARHRTLLGVSIAHFIVGEVALDLLDLTPILY